MKSRRHGRRAPRHSLRHYPAWVFEPALCSQIDPLSLVATIETPVDGVRLRTNLKERAPIQCFGGTPVFVLVLSPRAIGVVFETLPRPHGLSWVRVPAPGVRARFGDGGFTGGRRISAQLGSARIPMCPASADNPVRSGGRCQRCACLGRGPAGSGERLDRVLFSSSCRRWSIASH